MKLNNRLGIFFFSDKDGIVDSYVQYFLQEIAIVLSELFIIVAGNLKDEEKQKLSKYSCNIVTLTENIEEKDAYRIGINNFIGWNKINKWEQIIFFNNKNFGPFYLFQDIFTSMNKRKVDFWGILKYGKCVNGKWNKIAPRLNSNFLVVEKNILKSDNLRSFFDNNQLILDDFLVYFEKAGYISDAYINATEYYSEKPENNIIIDRYLSCDLIKKYRCPILGVNNLVYSDMDFNYTMGEDISRALQYIDEALSYDVDMIWKYILRVNDIVDLRNRLHINYVLSDKVKYNSQMPKTVYKNTVIIMHLYYMDLLEEVFAYIKNVPKDIDIIITSLEKNHEFIIKQAKLIGRNNIKILAAVNRGRDVAALLVTAREFLLEYEYLCFVHDKKTNGNAGAVTIGDSFRYCMWENTVKNAEYIDNILCTFEENPRLGLLSPPEPYHADHFHIMGNEWATTYEISKDLFSRLGIQVNSNKANGPFALSTSFWCRAKALKPLFQYEFVYEDFMEEPMPMDGTISHAIERSLIYVVQHEGYFSGIVENEEYAALHITNLQKMLSKMIYLLSEKYYFTGFNALCGNIHNNELELFCDKYKGVYIYGAGSFGHRVLKVLKNCNINVKGFIISDGQEIKPELEVPCYYLSEANLDATDGIVVAANKRYKAEILQSLKKFGYTNIFYKL